MAPVDFLIMIFTFLVTVLYNVEAGLEYGIIASVVILLLQIARLGTFSKPPSLPPSLPPSSSHVKILTNLPSLPPALPSLDIDSIGQLMVAEDAIDRKVGTHFRPLDKYPSARQHPAVKVLRLRANLFFGYGKNDERECGRRGK